jgi:hypothetical protein
VSADWAARTDGHFVVSTETEEHGRVEARASDLGPALQLLANKLRRLEVIEFTIEQIDVHYEGPVATVTIPDEAFAAAGIEGTITGRLTTHEPPLQEV